MSGRDNWPVHDDPMVEYESAVRMVEAAAETVGRAEGALNFAREEHQRAIRRRDAARHALLADDIKDTRP